MSQNKLEYVKRRLSEKILEYNLNEVVDKIPLSGEYRTIQYNDGSEDLVDVLAEFYLCKKHFVYFVDKYCYHLDSEKRKVSGLKLFDFQKKIIIPNFISKKYIIFRKCRQVGASVLSGQYALWLANFNIAQEILIISKTRQDAQDFKEKAIVSYDRLPDFIKTKPTRAGQTMTTLKLTNKSRIVTRAQSKDAGRGGSWSLVILDEAAFMPFADDIWSAVYPALSVSNGQCFIISTSNGVGNFYHRMWVASQNNENDFYPIYIPWWMFPGRDNEWAKKIEERDIKWIEKELGDDKVSEIKSNIDCFRFKKLYEESIINAFIEKKQNEQLSYNGPKQNKPWLKRMYDNSDSPRRFFQEILAEFLGSGNTVLSENALKTIEKQEKHPLYVDRIDNESDIIKGLIILEEPISDVFYTTSVDVASGAGEDYSAFIVFRNDTLEQVAEYKKQINTKDFAKIVKDVSKHYNNSLIIIETNQGQSVFNEIYLSESDPYYNVFYEVKNGVYRGLHTSPANKKLMVDEFINLLERNIIKIYGKRTIEELKVFIWHNGKPQASPGYNDDLVLTIMFFAYILKYGSINVSDFGVINKEKIVSTKKDMSFDLKKYEASDIIEKTYGISLDDYKWLVG